VSRTFRASPLVFVALFAAFAVGVLARPAIASAWYGLRSADAPEARPNAEFADADMLELARVQQQWGATGDIVMLGDSITAMGQWSEMFPAADILNRGLGGDTVADIAARAPIVLETKAKSIFLMVGVNDLFADATDEEIYRDLDRALEILGRDGATLYLQSPLVCGKGEVCTPERRARMRGWLPEFERIARAHEATYIDLNARMAGPDGLRETLSWDGIHPNGEGLKVWRDILRPYIESATKGAGGIAA